MITVIIAGAVLGAGVFLLVFAMIPRRLSLARQLAALDEFLGRVLDLVGLGAGALERRHFEHLRPQAP